MVSLAWAVTPSWPLDYNNGMWDDDISVCHLQHKDNLLEMWLASQVSTSPPFFSLFRMTKARNGDILKKNGRLYVIYC